MRPSSPPPPLLVSVFCLVLGLGLGDLGLQSGWVSPPWAGFLWVGLALGLQIWKGFRWGIAGLVWIVAGASLSLGVIVPPGGWVETPQRWQGEVEQVSPRMGGGCRLVVHLPEGQVRVDVKEGVLEVEEGAVVEFVARIRPFEDLGNPGETSSIQAARRRDLNGRAYVEKAGEVHILRRGVWFWRELGEVRRRLTDFVAGQVDPPERGVLLALLVGDTTELSAELRLAYMRSGLTHVLSISGLHVTGLASLVAGIIRWLLGFTPWAGSRLRRWIPPLMGLTLGAGYALLAGLPPAALRSLLMGLTVMGARAAAYHTDVLAPLLLAALALLIQRPGLLFDIGFQLSFVSMAAVMVLTPVVLSLLPTRWQKWPGVGVICTSVAASVGTAPLVAWHFHEVSTTAPLANLFGLFLLGSLATPLGLIAAALFLGGGTRVAGWALEGAAALVTVGDHIALLFGDPMYFPTLQWWPSPWELTLGLLIGGVILWIREPRRVRRLVTTCSLGVVAILALGAWRPVEGPTLTLTQLAVGQGDSGVLELPDGQVWLVDGGPAPPGFETGARVVVPALRSMGHQRLDVMILSHPHPDHIDGLLGVVELVPVGELWLAEPGPGGFADRLWQDKSGRWQGEGDDPLVQLVRGVEARGGKIRTLVGGDSLRWKEVEVRVLHPSSSWPPPDRPSRSVNNGSLVLQVCWRGWGVLMAGDIERQAELALVKTGAILRSQVLKVPHHGSDTSTTAEFLDAVKPAVAVIGVGRHNRWNFPRPRVLSRLQTWGASILRTDQGATRVVLSPDHISCQHHHATWGWQDIAGCGQGSAPITPW